MTYQVLVRVSLKAMITTDPHTTTISQAATHFMENEYIYKNVY